MTCRAYYMEPGLTIIQGCREAARIAELRGEELLFICRGAVDFELTIIPGATPEEIAHAIWADLKAKGRIP